MRRSRWWILALAAYTAALAAAWVVEYRARGDAEQERDRALAEARRLRRDAARERTARKDSRRPSPAPEPEPGPATPDPVPVAANAPVRPAEPAGPADPQRDPEAPESSEDAGPLDLAAPSPFAIEGGDARASFEQLMAAWDVAVHTLKDEPLDHAWNELHAAMELLVQTFPEPLVELLEHRLRETPDERLREGLFGWLETASGERAQAIVREALVRPEPTERRFGTAHLGALPEDEAVASWDRLLRDPDPDVRKEAADYLPGNGPRYAEILERAAAAETDSGLRGEMLAMAFDSHPVPDRLDHLLYELQRNRDPHFRLSVVTGMGGHLTLRDSPAIEALRRIALDSTETAGVRDAAFETLLNTDPPLLPKEEHERMEKTWGEVWAEDGDE